MFVSFIAHLVNIICMKLRIVFIIINQNINFFRPDINSTNFKLKLFALELLLSILRDSHESIQRNNNVIISTLIKKYLCLSLTQNIVLPIEEVC
jgi:hypothetical protein